MLNEAGKRPRDPLRDPDRRRKGQSFSAGANLADPKTHTIASPADFIDRIAARAQFAANLLTDFPKPVIAAVNGYAIGIGCIATYCCDLIVASERGRMAPAAGPARHHAGAMAARCAWRAGSARATPCGRPSAFRSTADEAYRIGLAQWLVPHAELMERAMRGRRRHRRPAAARRRLAKESLNKGLDIANIKDASEVDSTASWRSSQTEDSKGSAQCLAREAHGGGARRLT